MRFGYRYRDIKYDNMILRVYRWLFGYFPEIGFRLRSEAALKVGTIQGNLILDAGCGAGAKVIGIDLNELKRKSKGKTNLVSLAIFPFLYLFSKLDIFSSEGRNGILILAKKTHI